MKTLISIFGLIAIATGALAQGGAPPASPAARPRGAVVFDADAANRLERDGMEVRIKDIARFRGVRSNVIQGYGLIVGLEGTGDTKKTPFTATLLANALKSFGTMIDPKDLDPKNVATVAITATLPPYASPGNEIDVTVTSIGDAKSLQGGYLLMAPLFGKNDDQNAMAVAQGPISVGGFNVSGGGGSSTQKNHVNVGRIPGGAIVERTVPFQMVFGGKMYVELEDGDLTTAQRIASAIRALDPGFQPNAIDGGTIEVTLPDAYSAVQAMSAIERLNVKVDGEGVVVINERTGTIVIGGNVKIGPAMIAQGSLRVVIQQFNYVSQPGPFGEGTTTVETNDQITATEESSLGVVGPTNTVADLARIFQALKVTPRDMIAILQALKEQGALRAKIRIQ